MISDMIKPLRQCKSSKVQNNMVSIFLSKVRHLGNTVHDFELFCQPESHFIHYLLQLPDISQEMVSVILTPWDASQVGWSKDAVGL